MRLELLLFLWVTTANTAVVATPQLDSVTYKKIVSSGKNGMIKFFQPVRRTNTQDAQ